MIPQITLKVLHSFISYLLTPSKPGCTPRSLGRAPLSDPPSSLKTMRRLLVLVTFCVEQPEQLRPESRSTLHSASLRFLSERFLSVCVDDLLFIFRRAL